MATGKPFRVVRTHVLAAFRYQVRSRTCSRLVVFPLSLFLLSLRIVPFSLGDPSPPHHPMQLQLALSVCMFKLRQTNLSYSFLVAF